MYSDVLDSVLPSANEKLLEYLQPADWPVSSKALLGILGAFFIKLVSS